MITINIERLEHNPIINPSMKGLEGMRGMNINGPTLIRVPSWVPNPLGQYYLYFAHHHGDYIRLAYAENIEGPYNVHLSGTLNLDQLPFRAKHLASPEILINEEQKNITMYFHANVRGKGIYKDQIQMTYRATSEDGIHFKAMKDQLAPFYLRVFPYAGYYYGIAKNENKDGMLVTVPIGNGII